MSGLYMVFYGMINLQMVVFLNYFLFMLTLGALVVAVSGLKSRNAVIIGKVVPEDDPILNNMFQLGGSTTNQFMGI